MSTLGAILEEPVAGFTVEYRVHATRRMFERGILSEDVDRVLESGLVIERYVDEEFFQETAMTCAICRNGTTKDGFVTVTLERGSTILVFKNVPAKVCDNCGEEYLSAEDHRKLLRQAEAEVARGVELELLAFAA